MDNQCPHETFKGLYRVTKDKESLLKRLGHVQMILERNMSNYCVSEGKEIIVCSVSIRPKIAYI